MNQHEKADSDRHERKTLLKLQERSKKALLEVVKKQAENLLNLRYNKLLVSGEHFTPSFKIREDLIRLEIGTSLSGQSMPDALTLKEMDLFSVFTKRRLVLLTGASETGKTFSLLRIMQRTLQKAKTEPENITIPLVLDLESWRAEESIVDWIIRLLQQEYDVEKDITEHWLEMRYLLPLIDNFSAINRRLQQSCIEQIATFVETKHPQKLLLCSQTEDIEKWVSNLPLNCAVELLPFDATQVKEILTRQFPEQKALYERITNESVLQEIASSPAILNLLCKLSEGGESIPGSQYDSVAERRTAILDAYIAREVEQNDQLAVHSSAKVTNWLSFLAGNMSATNSRSFKLEDFQPSWLPSRAWAWCYLVLSRLLAGVLAAWAGGLLISPFNSPVAFLPEGNFWLPCGLIAGSILAICEGFNFGVVRQRPLLASIRVRYRPKLNFLSIGLLIGLATGFLFEEVIGFYYGLLFALLFGIQSNQRSIRQDIRLYGKIGWSWVGALKGTLVFMGLSVSLSLLILLRLAYAGGMRLIPGVIDLWKSESGATALAIIALAILIYLFLLIVLFMLLGGSFNGFKRLPLTKNLTGKLVFRKYVFVSTLASTSITLIVFLVIKVCGAIFLYNYNRVSVEPPELVGVQLIPLGFAVLAFLWHGGFDLLKHMILRLCLLVSNNAPVRYGRFLKQSSEFMVEESEGLRYSFISKVIKKHLALKNPSFVAFGQHVSTQIASFQTAIIREPLSFSLILALLSFLIFAMPLSILVLIIGYWESQKNTNAYWGILLALVNLSLLLAFDYRNFSISLASFLVIAALFLDRKSKHEDLLDLKNRMAQLGESLGRYTYDDSLKRAYKFISLFWKKNFGESLLSSKFIGNALLFSFIAAVFNMAILNTFHVEKNLETLIGYYLHFLPGFSIALWSVFETHNFLKTPQSRSVLNTIRFLLTDVGIRLAIIWATFGLILQLIAISFGYEETIALFTRAGISVSQLPTNPLTLFTAVFPGILFYFIVVLPFAIKLFYELRLTRITSFGFQWFRTAQYPLTVISIIVLGISTSTFALRDYVFSEPQQKERSSFFDYSFDVLHEFWEDNEPIVNLGFADSYKKSAEQAEAAGEYNLAITNYKRYLKWLKESNKSDSVDVTGEITFTHNHIGRNYGHLKQADSGMVHYSKAMEMYVKHTDSLSVPKVVATYQQLGSKYLILGDSSKADSAFKKGIRFGENDSSSVPIIAKLHTNLANISFERADYPSVIEHADRGRLLARKYKLPSIECDALVLLYSGYNELGQLEKIASIRQRVLDLDCQSIFNNAPK